MVASCKNGCTLVNLTENTLLCNFFFFIFNFDISRPLDVDFIINLTQGDNFISRFYYIFDGYLNKKLTLPTYQHCFTIIIIIIIIFNEGAKQWGPH